ncbi:hypothetical protein [Methylorubrum sp. DB1722]|uniref:hypothetical protein n=1 Tax=Methylorubrum sp. DB1722 TaxID=2478916 RepID=UPI0018E2D4B2|nr:hypothetical protein [Methylorubrum sp. DB1722]MBI1689537.1 hypothetical protein [Methylorubrum sp. DB1722]
MADILDVITAFQSSQPRGKSGAPQGSATTEESAYGPGDLGTYNNLKVSARRYFPLVIDLPAAQDSDAPLNGAEEILSVTQTRGAKTSLAPVSVRTYQQRGNVL